MSSFIIDEGAIFQRLCGLLAQVGIDADEKAEKSEIKAYVAGIRLVAQSLSGIFCNSALNIFSHPLMSELEKAFENEQYEMSGLKCSFTEYSEDIIGALVYSWLTPLHSIDLGADGISWEDVDEGKISFDEIENAKYRWDMIESR